MMVRNFPRVLQLALLGLALLTKSQCSIAFLPTPPITTPQTKCRSSLQKSTSVAASETTTAPLDDPTFTPPNLGSEAKIGEMAAIFAASRMKRALVPVPSYISPTTQKVGISYVHWKPENPSSAPPLLLVHGFDSSCLEYRRLGPKLANLGIESYAVDLLGWGYSQLEGVESFSAQAKVDALVGFWESVGGGRDVCIAGASLGGAAAVDFCVGSLKEKVKGAVFIDAQGFVDGVGPMAMLPDWAAKAGVGVLKSVLLRSSGSKMSYYDVETYATEDALKVGRFHCLREGWNGALVDFMKSGGFAPSEKIARISAPSLVLWGRDDGILEKEFAQKFLDTLPDAELEWIEECGHVPHLEQPEEAARLISEFMKSDRLVYKSAY